MSCRSAILIASLVVAGCATVVSGTESQVLFQSQPPRTTCTVTRDGQAIATLVTPQAVKISNSRVPLTVSCTSPGYLDGEQIVESEFTGTTFGNVLLGGFIGIAVDAASGANNRYPERVDINLIPTKFDSPAARDQFFDQRIAERQERQQREATAARQSCPQTPNQSTAQAQACQDAVDAINRKAEQDITRLNAQRASATVGS
ncbi:MAG: hypothetical protein SF002_12675 [Alphaproteobacteria bacterium]|nr:hypothetical protein [Alphaproteobacteria bacterium]